MPCCCLFWFPYVSPLYTRIYFLSIYSLSLSLPPYLSCLLHRTLPLIFLLSQQVEETSKAVRPQAGALVCISS